MYEDQPDEQVQEDLTACLYDQALGHPIAGTRETVATIGRERMLEFYRSRYTPETLFITMVGKLPRGAVRRLAEAFHVKPKGKTSHIVEYPPVLINRDKCRPKKIEQLHVCMANAGLSITHKDRYALHLLSNHLGTGMSSRLFQEIREKRGLAYSVYSFVQSYADIGMFGVYAATSPGKLAEVVDVTLAECDRLASRGLPESRLVQLKDMVMGGLQLGLEKAGARMSRMGIGYRYFGRVVPIDEVVAAVQAVSTDDLKRVARAVFRGGFDSVTAVGPIDESDFEKIVAPRKNRTPFVDP
jgi:predicted Zn-dependent peptidase